MKKSFLQKMWLGAIILLFAGTVGYGGYVLSEMQAPARESALEDVDDLRKGEWKDFATDYVLLSIPSEWEGGYLYGDVEGLGYIFRNPGEDYSSPYRQSNLRDDLQAGEFLEGEYAISFSIIRGGRIVEDWHEGARHEIFSVDGRGATRISNDEGLVFVAVEGGTYNFFWETYDYDRAEVARAFDHMIETAQIQED